MSYCVIDLETAGTTTYKRFCNQFDPKHKIIISAQKQRSKAPSIIYNNNNYSAGIDAGTVFSGIDLSSLSLLIGQNLKFDMLWFWGWKPFREWIMNGGKVWDTQTVEYLLNAQFREKIDLDSLATKYGGTVKDDRVGTMFKAGITADQIEKDILVPYAEQDVINTEIVFKAQYEQVKQEGMLPLVRGYMEHYLALCEMEYNGLYIDVSEAQQLTNNYEEKLSEALIGAQRALSETDWPSDLVHFNPGSLDHVSVALFGGEIAYVADIEKLDEEGAPLTYKTGARAGEIKTKKEKLIKNVIGQKIAPKKEWKAKKEGYYKADDKILTQLQNSDVNEKQKIFIQNIMAYRKAQKVLKTYLFYTEYNAKGKVLKESGFIPLVHKHSSAIHTSFKTAVTRTGRLASRDPNVQNIDPDILSIFASRWGDNGCLIEFDYGMLEVVVQAYLSQCPNFIRDIENGVDFHCKRLSYLVNRPYEEVYNLCQESNEWKLKRKKAKAVSFQKAYGAAPASIAASTGLKQEDVETIFNKEDMEYPEVKLYYEGVLSEAQSSSVPTNIVLNVRDKKTGAYYKKETEHHYVGYFRSMTGKKYSFLDKAVLTKRGDIFRYYSMPDIYDYPVQGFAADLVALQVGRVFRALLPHRDKCLLINEIHDAVLLDVKKEFKDLIVEKVCSILQDVDGTFQKYFGIKFNVPIHVDHQVGNNWKELKEVE